jgi:hypothetical protein
VPLSLMARVMSRPSAASSIDCSSSSKSNGSAARKRTRKGPGESFNEEAIGQAVALGRRMMPKLSLPPVCRSKSGRSSQGSCSTSGMGEAIVSLAPGEILA